MKGRETLHPFSYSRDGCGHKVNLLKSTAAFLFNCREMPLASSSSLKSLLHFSLSLSLFSVFITLLAVFDHLFKQLHILREREREREREMPAD